MPQLFVLCSLQILISRLRSLRLLMKSFRTVLLMCEEDSTRYILFASVRCALNFLYILMVPEYVGVWWLGSAVVRALESRSAGRGFNFRPRHDRATTLGKLFTPMWLCSPSSIIWYLARAFMLTRRLCGSGMGSNEQGEYCSSVFCSDLDRFNRDINYLLTFYFFYLYH